MEQIRLSPSTLNLFADCGRCFWLHVNKGIHRPSAPFPSLPSGMDNVLKPYYDKYRLAGKLPPELEGKIEGKLFPDISKINRWRNWRTGLEYFDIKRNAKLIGALDDLLIVGGKYAPLDYKTRGGTIKEDSHTYYQLQLDLYALLLEGSGLPPATFGYLVFYSPREMTPGGVTNFTVEPVKVETSAESGRAVFEKAVELLRSEIPPHHSSCEYGLWQNENF